MHGYMEWIRIVGLETCAWPLLTPVALPLLPVQRLLAVKGARDGLDATEKTGETVWLMREGLSSHTLNHRATPARPALRLCTSKLPHVLGCIASLGARGEHLMPTRVVRRQMRREWTNKNQLTSVPSRLRCARRHSPPPALCCKARQHKQHHV